MKSVCISGASAGIGAAIAREFASLKWRVIIGARRPDRLLSLKEKLLELGASDVAAFDLDVTSTQSIAKFYTSTSEFLKGPPSVLVNNAGLAIGTQRLSEIDDEAMEKMISTNVYGLVRLTRSFLPSMIAQSSGHIINIGSVAGFWTYEGGGIYCATKHAVRAISQTLRLELNGTPIRISEVAPGMVETEFSEVRLGDAERAKKVYSGMQPLTPADIAQCVSFIANVPPHVNIDHLVVTPVDQASPTKVFRRPT
jgi:NADP-dependent 3-hydroxy acid dehydrogenase YdfG